MLFLWNVLVSFNLSFSFIHYNERKIKDELGSLRGNRKYLWGLEKFLWMPENITEVETHVVVSVHQISV